jgi:hypothetical protein
MFEVAEAYEVMMGRWSRQLAPLFVEFVGVRGGPAAYVVALPEDRREALKQRFRRGVLGNRSEGAFTIKAKVWAVRGTVP